MTQRVNLLMAGVVLVVGLVDRVLTHKTCNTCDTVASRGGGGGEGNK